MKKKQYPFIIMNTDHNDKKGMHWWSFLDLHPEKEIFLFSSFGFDGFKEFLLEDDKKLLIKFSTELKNLKKRKQNNGNNFNLFYGRVLKNKDCK